MSYGVTPEGFVRPSFSDIQRDIISRVEDVLGPINKGDESLIYQEITEQAEREDLLWQALQSTYFASYPNFAEARSLDGAVQLTNIQRLPATKTRVAVDLTGDAGTTIPEGSQASNISGDLFELTEDVTLDGNGEAVGEMLALDAGRLLVLADTLVNIETPVSGWDTINNPEDGETGRDVESDSELRLRREQSVMVTATSTVEAIQSRLLQEVDDVSAVRVIENDTMDPDSSGRPPKSFEAVVSGGQQQDIGNLLWQVLKPAGIRSFGNITVEVEDSQGETQTVQFSRPVQIFIWAQIQLSSNGVGEMPQDAAAQATAAVVEAGNKLQIGDKVVYQSLFGPIYQAVPGLAMLEVKLASSDDPNVEPAPGEFQAQNLSVSRDAISEWDAARVEVTVD